MKKLNNQGKTVVIVIVCIVVLISVIGAIFFYRNLSKPMEINIEKYIKMEYEGYNGFGNAKSSLDYDSFYKDYNSKIEFKKSGKGYDDLLGFGTIDESTDLCKYIIDNLISINMGKSDKLSNGDVVNLSILYNEEALEKMFNIKLIVKDNYAYDVKGLMDVDVVDPFEDVELKCEGYEGIGTATLVNDSENELLKGFTYKMNKNDNLKNGMIVDVTIMDGDNELGENDYLDEYGIVFSKTKKGLVVEGLSDVNEVELFDEIDVMFEGANRHGIPVIKNNSVDEEFQNLKFAVDKNENLCNMDYVKVTITDENGNNPNKYLADNYGVKLKTLEKSFQVLGLREYATKASEVPEATMNEMQSQALDKINSQIANDYVSNSDMEYQALNSLNYIGNYFLNVKEDYIDKQDVQDAILFVYKANVTDSHENYRDHTPTVITKDIYYAVWFENIYLNDDGSAYVDLSNGYLSTKQNTKFGYYIFTYAYETIDFLKKYAVTPNLEKYVIEENITG